jgi:hypothetical protein
MRLEKNLVNTVRTGVLATENQWDFDVMRHPNNRDAYSAQLGLRSPN